MVITGAILDDTVSPGGLPTNGLTQQQFYSTASYKNRNLQGISLLKNDLSGWNFRSQDLSNASFYYDVNLADADLSEAILRNVDFRGATLAGTDFSDAVVNGSRFFDRTSNGFKAGQLYSTASYRNKDLRGIDLGYNDLTGWNLAGQDLCQASFDFSTVTNIELRDAIVAGASFVSTTSRGFTMDVLNSTASYQNRELPGIDFGQNDLRGWDFAGQNLMNASFVDTRLTDTDLTGADLRGATGLWPLGSTKNMIWPNGKIHGLRLSADDELVIRDSDRRIVVQDEFSIVGNGQLIMVLTDAGWKSTVAFEGLSTTPQLGGTLKILFGDTDFFDLVGTTFDLFNWENTIDPANHFAEIALPLNTEWDLSQLYATGQITFVSPFLDKSVGDFDSNLLLDAADIDLLSEQVRDGTNDPAFDLNADTLVDHLDRSIWVGQLFGTFVGDADLDQEVAFAVYRPLSKVSEPKEVGGRGILTEMESSLFQISSCLP